MPKPVEEVTTREAMELLGYTHPSTVNRMVREGRLKPTRRIPPVNGLYLFDKRDVLAIAAQGKPAAGRPPAKAAS